MEAVYYPFNAKFKYGSRSPIKMTRMVAVPMTFMTLFCLLVFIDSVR